MGRFIPAWLMGTILLAAIMTAAAVVFVACTNDLVRIAIVAFACSVIAILIFHPEFILRRLGAALISAGVVPHGVTLAVGHTPPGKNSSVIDVIAWLQVHGAATELMLLVGCVLLLFEKCWRFVQSRFLPPGIQLDSLDELSAVPTDDQGRFYFDIGLVLLKKADEFLRIHGARVNGLVPWSKAAFAAHGVAVASAAIPGAFDEATENVPVEVTALERVEIRLRFFVTNRLAAWAHDRSSGGVVRAVVAWTIARQVGARLTVLAGGRAQNLCAVVRGPPSRL